MGLADLDGRSYGPRPLAITPDRVADFVAVTGDDSRRWTDAAPPGFAAAALFEVAPQLLDEISDHSVIHGEQTFEWDGPMEMGSGLEVIGKVTRVRHRAGVNYVTFEVLATEEGRPVVTGTSLFLVSGESVPAGSTFEREEPPHSYRGEVRSGQRAASRADLIRYAAATRDWNPVHWDHQAAVAAGLPGVVAHGLLQAAWAFEAASRGATGQAPLESGRARFRNPLLPGRPVDLSISGDGREVSVVVKDEDHEYLTASIVKADG